MGLRKLILVSCIGVHKFIMNLKSLLPRSVSYFMRIPKYLSNLQSRGKHYLTVLVECKFCLVKQAILCF